MQQLQVLRPRRHRREQPQRDVVGITVGLAAPYGHDRRAMSFRLGGLVGQRGKLVARQRHSAHHECHACACVCACVSCAPRSHLAQGVIVYACASACALPVPSCCIVCGVGLALPHLAASVVVALLSSFVWVASGAYSCISSGTVGMGAGPHFQRWCFGQRAPVLVRVCLIGGPVGRLLPCACNGSCVVLRRRVKRRCLLVDRRPLSMVSGRRLIAVFVGGWLWSVGMSGTPFPAAGFI